MRRARIFVRCFSVMISILATAVLSMLVYADCAISESYCVVEGGNFSLDCKLPVTTEFCGAKPSQSVKATRAENEYNVRFKLLGVIPVADSSVTVINDTSVAVIGKPFGVKLYTDGVLVVGVGEVDGGGSNPAEKAGIRVGDTIKSIDGKAVSSNEEICKIIESSEGKSLDIVIIRNGKKKTVSLKPAYSQTSGSYKAGLWVRDSTAGIGTLTFYSPATETICGLGHGICDGDTDQLMTPATGEVVKAEIISYVKGNIGSPGELKGRLGNSVIGRLLSNHETGVYAGAAYKYKPEDLVSIAMKQDIQNGPAYIYTTIKGSSPKLYSCEIKICSEHESENTHNLIVTVTDNELLKTTGGIVQGMSGSPILQNGKLVGAVTHVFVNDPKKGYGIFAENMLNTARRIAKPALDAAS